MLHFDSHSTDEKSMTIITNQATKARNALWLMFFVMGVVSMAWVPRIPEIKTANALTDTQFGLVLVASSVVFI
jgi:hypothetical protein